MPKLKVRDQLAKWRERYPAPCQAVCPVHTDARAYVTLIADGKFEDAFAAARGPNPMAAICGRACSAPCEDVCTRGEFDRPIRIRQLKGFLADRYEVEPPAPSPASGRRVAVIGAGPAGLTAAHDLRLAGHEVAVFEAASEPGGMATLGVPRFRLGFQSILDDVDTIRAMGVTFNLGVRVGEEVSLVRLQSDHDAVFIATGAVSLNELSVPGRDLRGVVQALPYLTEANLGGRPWTGKRVAVIGGGYTAMDAARTALRLSADSVTILYRRTRNETEVHEAELRETLHEGVRIEYLVSPLAVDNDGSGGVAGVRCVRNSLGAPDSSGRPRPVPIEGSEFAFDADMVILAVGQWADAAELGFEPPERLSEVDPVTMMTGVHGVFAGGDFVSGPSTIIEAVAEGQRAARSIDEFLRPGSRGATVEGLTATNFTVRPRANRARWNGRTNGHGAGVPALSLDTEVEAPLSESEAISEGLRCLFCGLLPTIILDECTMCHACVQVCPEECIHLVRPDNVWATSYRDAVSYQIDSDLCIRCGRCMGACPVEAISVAD